MSIFLLILLIIIATFVYAGFRGAPWVPTRGRDVERFLKLAEIKSGQKVYDLGCGDGRIVCEAAKAGARAQGFEISLLPYIIAKVRCYSERKRCSILYKDFWNVNLGDADLVYFFLMQKCYPKLKEKFERELKRGTKVIAYVWPIQGWTPVAVDTTKGYPPMYLYQIK